MGETAEEKPVLQLNRVIADQVNEISLLGPPPAQSKFGH